MPVLVLLLVVLLVLVLVLVLLMLPSGLGQNAARWMLLRGRGLSAHRAASASIAWPIVASSGPLRGEKKIDMW